MFSIWSIKQNPMSNQLASFCKSDRHHSLSFIFRHSYPQDRRQHVHRARVTLKLDKIPPPPDVYHRRRRCRLQQQQQAAPAADDGNELRPQRSAFTRGKYTQPYIHMKNINLLCCAHLSYIFVRAYRSSSTYNDGLLIIQHTTRTHTLTPNRCRRRCTESLSCAKTNTQTCNFPLANITSARPREFSHHEEALTRARLYLVGSNGKVH